jgi:hypothetical protein
MNDNSKSPASSPQAGQQVKAIFCTICGIVHGLETPCGGTPTFSLSIDTERLNWLDGGSWWDFCRSANPQEPEKTFHLDIGEGEHCETYSAKSAREAIDAARGKTQQAPAGQTAQHAWQREPRIGEGIAEKLNRGEDPTGQTAPTESEPLTMSAKDLGVYRRIVGNIGYEGQKALLEELDAREFKLAETREIAGDLTAALERTTFALRQAIQRAERSSGGDCPENWLDAEVLGRSALAKAKAADLIK